MCFARSRPSTRRRACRVDQLVLVQSRRVQDAIQCIVSRMVQRVEDYLCAPQLLVRCRAISFGRLGVFLLFISSFAPSLGLGFHDASAPSCRLGFHVRLDCFSHSRLLLVQLLLVHSSTL